MNFLEFIGYFLGDGCIIYKPSKSIYALELSGNVIDQDEYFHTLSAFLKNESNYTPRLRIRKKHNGQSLTLRIDNKKFIERLIFEEGLVHKNKTFTAKIPEKYLSWNKSKEIIRGLFEADGSLYFSRSKKSPFPTYPRIEIKSASKQLLSQVNAILHEKNFQTSVYASKTDNTSRILLSGIRMLKKWKCEIGFSDPKTISKYDFWSYFGFYLPGLNYPERKAILLEIKQIHL